MKPFRIDTAAEPLLRLPELPQSETASGVRVSQPPPGLEAVGDYVFPTKDDVFIAGLWASMSRARVPQDVRNLGPRPALPLTKRERAGVLEQLPVHRVFFPNFAVLNAEAAIATTRLDEGSNPAFAALHYAEMIQAISRAHDVPGSDAGREALRALALDYVGMHQWTVEYDMARQARNMSARDTVASKLATAFLRLGKGESMVVPWGYFNAATLGHAMALRFVRQSTRPEEGPFGFFDIFNSAANPYHPKARSAAFAVDKQGPVRIENIPYASIGNGDRPGLWLKAMVESCVVLAQHDYDEDDVYTVAMHRSGGTLAHPTSDLSKYTPPQAAENSCAWSVLDALLVNTLPAELAAWARPFVNLVAHQVFLDTYSGDVFNPAQRYVLSQSLAQLDAAQGALVRAGTKSPSQLAMHEENKQRTAERLGQSGGTGTYPPCTGPFARGTPARKANGDVKLAVPRQRAVPADPTRAASCDLFPADYELHASQTVYEFEATPAGTWAATHATGSLYLSYLHLSDGNPQAALQALRAACTATWEAASWDMVGEMMDFATARQSPDPDSKAFLGHLAHAIIGREASGAGNPARDTLLAAMNRHFKTYMAARDHVHPERRLNDAQERATVAWLLRQFPGDHLLKERQDSLLGHQVKTRITAAEEPSPRTSSDVQNVDLQAVVDELRKDAANPTHPLDDLPLVHPGDAFAHAFDALMTTASEGTAEQRAALRERLAYVSASESEKVLLLVDALTRALG